MRGVKLVPGVVGRDARDGLDGRVRRAGQNEGDVGVARGLRQQLVGMAPVNAGNADRRNAEQTGVFPAEQFDAGIDWRDVGQPPRDKLILAERVNVAPDAAAVAGAPFEITADEMGQAPQREAAQILDIHRTVDCRHCFALVCWKNVRALKYSIKCKTNSAIPTGTVVGNIGTGWSGRVTAGLNATATEGTSLLVNSEDGGLGANYKIWSSDVRGTVPF